MFDINESQNLYLQQMLEKAQRMVDKINGYPFVSKAYLKGQGIQVEFEDSVDIENQNILDLFLRGGAIKKSKDNSEDDDEFILVEPIGDF